MNLLGFVGSLTAWAGVGQVNMFLNYEDIDLELFQGEHSIFLILVSTIIKAEVCLLLNLSFTT